LCGECQSDGTCNFTGQAGGASARPGAICLQPYGSTSCTVGDDASDLSVEFNPGTNCSPIPLVVALNNNPSLCLNGWYIEKPSTCQQDFVNDYKVQSSCVNGGAEANIHASCSEEIGLCYDYCGFLLVAYSILGQTPPIWYTPSNAPTA
jgi:hypothetical protein